MEDKQKLIVLTGPTAVGKTELSIKLAKELDGEIISADSMQVYRGMDIGTAKIKPSEMDGVRHHLIDIIGPDEEFSVLIFKDLAKKAVEDIASRGKLPIVVGGTGFYIQALLYDVDFVDYSDEEQEKVRTRLEEELKAKGALYMHEYLASFDRRSAEIIHMNNTKRMLHAIEFYELTGRRMSDHNEEQHERTSPYDFMYLVLNDDREKVYKRIDQRVDRMFEEGLEEEVAGLLKKGIGRELTSMLGLGYKETADYLCGEISLDEAKRLIKRDTRHFAKKQLTWFKREKETLFIDRQDHRDEEELYLYTLKLIRDHFGKEID